MRLAFGSVASGSDASAPEPSKSKKLVGSSKLSGHYDAQSRAARQSCRDRVLAGIAMLCLGLAAGLMLGSVIGRQGADGGVSQAMVTFELVFFAGAAIALLILLSQGGEEGERTVADPKRADSPSASDRGVSTSVSAIQAVPPAAVGDPAAAETVGAESAVDATPAQVHEVSAPLHESEAALLERLVMSTDRYDIVCEKLSRRNLLSPRQTEVLRLLARGRNASYIEEKLCISLSTAKSHIGSVYRKLGVHNQQELLALVQDGLDEADLKSASASEDSVSHQ